MWREKKIVLSSLRIPDLYLLENRRPLSPWGPRDFLLTCLGIDSLSSRMNQSLLWLLDFMS